MRVEVLQDLARVQALQPAWDRLWSADATADVFATCDWFLNWWDHFGHGDQKDPIVTHDGADIVAVPGRDLQLHVCTVRDETDELVAVLPLVFVFGLFKGVPARILSTPVNSHAPRSGLLARQFESDVAACLCAGLVSHGAWDVLLLDGLAQADRTAALIAALAAHRLILGGRASWAVDYLRFHGSWEEFVAGGKRQHFRRSLVKARRGLEKFGAVSVQQYARGEALEHGIELFMQVDGSSWKAHSGESVDRDPRLRAYYTDICRRFGDRGSAEVWILRLGGTPAAVFLCLHDRRSRYTVKSSYSEAFGASRSPSLVLLHEIVRQTWGTDAGGIDFSGKVPFLDRWSNEELVFEQAVFYRSRLWALRVRGRDKLRQIFRKAKTAAKQTWSSVSGRVRTRDA